MHFFAIRHIPTGRLLPAPRGRNGRGGTHVEFGDEGMPRLFEKEQSAKLALRPWLQGKINVFQRFDDSYADETWSVEPTPHRKAEECEIVRVELTVLSP